MTIAVTATLNVPTNKNTVIDGGRKITLDGGGAVQILRFDSANFQANDNGLTLQHIALVNGKATPTEMIPTAPAPCSQGWNDGEGGALYMRDGNLIVIDSIFTNNQAAPLGPDTGGGAIYVLGSKHGVWIVGSTFTNNQASNAGAVGGLFAELNIYNSLFRTTTRPATTRTTTTRQVRRHQQRPERDRLGRQRRRDLQRRQRRQRHAVRRRRARTTPPAPTPSAAACSSRATTSAARSPSADTTMTGNTGGYWTQVQSGSVTNAGTAVGTNCRASRSRTRRCRAFRSAAPLPWRALPSPA